MLIELDLETGAHSAVGTVGGFGFDGLTMAADGSLYGVSSFSDDLWRINRLDGNGTRIGPLNVPVTEATGLASTPAALFGWSRDASEDFMK